MKILIYLLMLSSVNLHALEFNDIIGTYNVEILNIDCISYDDPGKTSCEKVSDFDLSSKIEFLIANFIGKQAYSIKNYFKGGPLLYPINISFHPDEVRTVVENPNHITHHYENKIDKNNVVNGTLRVTKTHDDNLSYSKIFQFGSLNESNEFIVSYQKNIIYKLVKIY